MNKSIKQTNGQSSPHATNAALMTMQPDTQPNLHTTKSHAVIGVNFVDSKSVFTISIDNLNHTMHKTILKNPQDLFTWGSINTKDNLKGQQTPLYSANQLTLGGHQCTPTIVDLHHYKYWLVIEGQAVVTIGRQTQQITANQTVLLPPMNECQLTNLLPTPLVMVQIQCRHGFNPRDLSWMCVQRQAK